MNTRRGIRRWGRKRRSRRRKGRKMEIGVLNAIAVDFAYVEVLLDGLDVRCRDPVCGAPDDWVLVWW